MASLFGFGKSADSNTNTGSSTVNTSGSQTSAGGVRTANAEQAGEVHEQAVASNAARGGASTTTTTTTTGAGHSGSNVATNQYAATGASNVGVNDANVMTRSEERLHVGKETVEAGKARLHKYVTTEQVQTEVGLQKESVTLEREPITDGRALAGAEIKEAEFEVNLQAERAVVTKEVVPLEKVRLNKQVEQTTQAVGGEVRKEHIEYGTTAGVQTNTVQTGGSSTTNTTHSATRGA